MQKFMDMPVYFGRDKGNIYGQIAENLVLETFEEDYGLKVKYTDYHCPIDGIVENEYGVEIRYRAPTDYRTIMRFTAKERKNRLKYCRKHGLKPITVLVYALDYGLVEITYKKGIKNIAKGFRGEPLEDFINDVVDRKTTKN